MAFSATPIDHAIAGGLNSATTGAINTTGADLLVISVGWYNGITTDVTVSDSKGNTWIPLTKNSTTILSERLWYCVSPSVGSGHTFTSSGTSCYHEISVSAWSGSNATPVDQQNSNSSTSAFSLATGSITPSVDGCLLITGLAGAVTSYTINGGFTISDQISLGSGNNQAGGQAYLVHTTAAAANPTWTGSESSYITAVIASFKPAVGGAGSVATGAGSAVGSAVSGAVASGTGVETGTALRASVASGTASASGVSKSGSVASDSGAAVGNALAGSVAQGAGTATGAALSQSQSTAAGTGTATGVALSGSIVIGSYGAVGAALRGSLAVGIGTTVGAAASSVESVASGTGTAVGAALSGSVARGLGVATGLARSPDANLTSDPRFIVGEARRNFKAGEQRRNFTANRN